MIPVDLDLAELILGIGRLKDTDLLAPKTEASETTSENGLEGVARLVRPCS
jgi:hypothetical protein